MVCNALVAGGRRSGAGQQAQSAALHLTAVEQITSAIHHSEASSCFLPYGYTTMDGQTYIILRRQMFYANCTLSTSFTGF